MSEHLTQQQKRRVAEWLKRKSAENRRDAAKRKEAKK